MSIEKNDYIFALMSLRQGCSAAETRLCAAPAPLQAGGGVGGKRKRMRGWQAFVRPTKTPAPIKLALHLWFEVGVNDSIFFGNE